MNVTLKPEHARLIDEQVKAGRFDSPDAAVAEAIERLAADVEPDAEDLAAVREGLEQLRGGEGMPWDEVRARLVSRRSVGQ